jgi:hypothetical protein
MIKTKKRKKITPYRKLFLKAERLWKQAAFLRDGRECQVAKLFPQINTTHSQILQIDHCITRMDKNFFFDIRNATVVCSNCNMHKKNRFRGIDWAIQKIVMDRESAEVFGMMMELHQSGTPNYNFTKIWWIEKVIADLEDYIDNYKSCLRIEGL